MVKNIAAALAFMCCGLDVDAASSNKATHGGCHKRYCCIRTTHGEDNMIKADEKFEFERETFGWTLHQWRDGKDKDGKTKRHKSMTFYGNLRQVCLAIVDRSCGECKSVAEILRGLDRLERVITMAVGTTEATEEYQT